MKDHKNIIKITQELDTQVLNKITKNVKYNAVHDSFYYSNSDNIIYFDINEVYSSFRYTNILREILIKDKTN